MSRKNTFLTLLGLGAGAVVASKAVRRQRIAAREGRFAGKTVLITGASRGIGEAVALEFARRGANLVLAARSANQIDRVASTCETINPQIETLVVPTDITDEAQRKRVVDEAVSHFGQVDVLVNNAGVILGSDTVSLPRQALEEVLDVNLLSHISLTQLILPGMLKRGEGLIINMGSVAGSASMPYFIPYDVTKAAQRAFSEGLRHELHGTGVEVVLVAPGYVETDIVGEMRDVYKQMGFLSLLSPHTVARRTAEGVLAGDPVVRIGWLATLGGMVNALFPRIIDLYWQRFVPRRRLREMAVQHGTE